MTRFAVLLLAGGLAAQHSTLPVPSDVASLLLVASLCAFFLRRARAPALFASGFALFHMAGQNVIDQRIEARFEGDSMLAVVRIEDFPRTSGDSLSMTVAPLDDVRLPPRARVSWFEAPVVPAIGEVWQLELRLRRPRGGANPGVFDVETWWFREKIHAVGYVVNGKRNRLLWEARRRRSTPSARNSACGRAQPRSHETPRPCSWPSGPAYGTGFRGNSGIASRSPVRAT